jgi:tetrahydromethanopterin S-methyltransferase subunit G
MKTHQKKIKIEVNFNDFNELKYHLETILNRSKFGYKSDKTQDYSFDVSDNIEPRIELVNGEKCMIIPSKMNF